jgi:CRAL/TRIO domain
MHLLVNILIFTSSRLFPLYCWTNYTRQKQLASERYAKYWAKRIEIFGEKAFQPITLNAALKDDVETLKMGFIQCLHGCRDARGRRIVYLDCVALNQPGVDNDSMLRCMLYVLHCAMEDEETQKYGVVALLHPNKNANPLTATTRTRMFVEAATGTLPIRQAGVHVFRPPSFLKPIISIVLLLVTEQTRRRTRIHYGEEEDGLKAAAKYGLSSSALPRTVGGTYHVDMDAWVKHRQQLEAESPRF